MNSESFPFYSVFTSAFSNRCIEGNWLLSKNMFSHSDKLFFPLITVKSNSASPCCTNALKNISNRKGRLFQFLKQSPTPIRKDLPPSWNEDLLCSPLEILKCNPVNSKMLSIQSPHNLLHLSAKDCANLLNNFFCSISTDESTWDLVAPYPVCYHTVECILIEVAEIHHVNWLLRAVIMLQWLQHKFQTAHKC